MKIFQHYVYSLAGIQTPFLHLQDELDLQLDLVVNVEQFDFDIHPLPDTVQRESNKKKAHNTLKFDFYIFTHIFNLFHYCLIISHWVINYIPVM